MHYVLWLILGVILFLVLWTLKLNLAARQQGLPGPFILPYFGCALTLVAANHKAGNGEKGRLDFLTDCFSVYGDTWGMPILGQAMVATRDPVVVAWVTKDKFVNYKRWLPRLTNDFGFKWAKWMFGEGIFMTDDEVWSIQRTAASPLFNKESLDHMHEVFIEKGHDVIKILKEKQDRSEVFDLQKIFMSYTLDSFGIIGFNSDFDSLHNDLGFPPHFDRSQMILSGFFWDVPSRVGKPFEDFKESVNYINDYIYKRIKQLKSTDLENSKSKDLMTKFLNMRDADGQPYPEQWIKDIIVNFTIAGRDTTALLMTWTIYLLCTHPKVEEKLRKEMAGIGGDVTIESVKKLKYLGYVLTETLRVHPSVPLTSRHAENDDILPNGMKINAGTTVVYFQHFLHRNPQYWDDPEVFRPERWETHENKHPMQYTPFHAGPMQCLGRHMALNEAKLLLVMILKKYTFKLQNEKEIFPLIGIVAFLLPGLMVKVEPAAEDCFAL